jgi:type I restriction enzyme S subunit
MSDEDVSASEIEDLLLPEDMPSDWSIRQIGDLKVMKNSRVKPEDMGEQNYVSLKHMGEGEPRIYEWESSEGVGSAKYEFQPGDIMLGKLRPYFRKVAMPKIDGICSTDINVIAATEEVDQKFLFYTLFRQEFIDIADKSSTGTRMPRADWSKLDKLNVALPPLEEQNRIGEFLHSIDEKIEVNRAMSETLEDIAHAIYTSWFVDYEPYTSDEFTENHQPVSTLGKFVNGYSFSQNNVTDSGEPIIKIRELNSGVSDNSDYYPEKEDVDEKYTLSAGDVLLSWSASLDVFLWKKNKGLLNQHIYKVRPSGRFSQEFVYFSLKQALAQLENRADGTTMSHINRSDLDEVSVECLTPEMRERFTDTTQPILDEIIRLEQENESLAEIRDYLLPQLLSGEVRLGGDDA